MSVMVKTALLLPCLVSFAALTIDLARLRASHTEAQTAADFAAMAGAEVLDDGPTAVDATAVAVGALNVSDGRPVAIADADVDVGDWDGATFTVDADGDYVRVVARQPGVRMYFAALMGITSEDVSARAIAGFPGGRGGTWPCTMFADQTFELNGNARVDSWDSTAGTYNDTAGSEAGVCGNMTSITTQGNFAVYGDVHPGPDGTVSIAGSSYVSGDTSALAEKVTLATVSLPSTYSTLTCPTKTTDVVTLDAGKTYYVSGDCTVHGTINVNGTSSSPTKLYAGGDFHANGNGFVNASLDPHSFELYSPNGHEIEINGNADFYGQIYAPTSEIQINGNEDFYGSVVGQYIHANGNGDIHLDVSLASGGRAEWGKLGGGTVMLVQ